MILEMLALNGYTYAAGMSTVKSERDKVYRKEVRHNKLLIWQLAVPRRKKHLFSILILQPTELAYQRSVLVEDSNLEDVFANIEKFVSGYVEAYKIDTDNLNNLTTHEIL